MLDFIVSFDFLVYYLSLDFTYFFSSCQLTVDFKQALDSVNGDSANLGLVGFFKEESPDCFRTFCEN
jgi:hypothetical protein